MNSETKPKKSDLKKIGGAGMELVSAIGAKTLTESQSGELKTIVKKSSIGPRVEVFRKLMSEIHGEELHAYTPGKMKANRTKKFDDTRYYDFDENGEIDPESSCFKTQSMPSEKQCMRMGVDDEDDI